MTAPTQTAPDPLRRASVGWGVALLALGAALCAVPLFNLLAFEFAFAVGVPATFAAGGLGVRAARAWPDRPLAAWGRATARTLALLALPLIPITLNALRVRNCNYLQGLALYALLPGATAAIGSGWGVALGRLWPRRARALYPLAVLATVALALWRFWSQPPVDAFNAFLGYWPGALYDEFIPVGARLVVSRLEALAWAAAAVLAVRGLSGGLGARRLAGAGLLVAVVSTGAAMRLDLYRDAAHVQGALGGHRATEHFDIYFDKSMPEAFARGLADELEFDHAELSAFFGRAPTVRVQAYLYPDQATKKRLMGAGRTRIAKPWQRAIHVHGAAVGQRVLAHELAHVFSADLADGPTHLPLHRGWLPHMPLIEGLAEAATWPADRLDLHQWSAAMRAIDVAPPLPAVLAPTGFYLHSARTAYTLCGSFVRDYRERHGPEALHAVYRAGAFPPAEFDAAHAAWLAHLDGLVLPPAALQYARARFDRPSIFGKVCAHELAALRHAAGAAAQRGDLAAALAHTDAVLGHVPGEPDARLTRIGLLLALDRVADARAAAEALRADHPGDGTLGRRAAEWVADLAALGGPAAPEDHAALLTGAFPRAEQRRLAVKAAAAEAGVPAVIDWLSRPRPAEAARAAIAAIAAAHPGWGVATYLNARALIGQADADPAAALQTALAQGLPHPALRLEAERLLADLAFDAADYAQAAARYARLAGPGDLNLSAGERAELARWARRARFFGARVDKRSARSEDRAAPGE